MATRFDPLLDRLKLFGTNPVLAWLLVAGNLLAVWWGYTVYYAGQFAVTHPALWVFVPDSPNAVLAFAVALALRQFGKRNAFVDLLAWCLNVKVGIWTVFVLLYYYEAFFADEPVLRWILLWLHVGMVAQALVLHRDLRTRALGGVAFAVVAGWLVLGDVLDYGPLDLHPYLRGPARPVVAFVTVVLSALTLTWASLWYRPGRPRDAARGHATQR